MAAFRPGVKRGCLSAEDEAYEIYLTDEDVLESKCWGESSRELLLVLGSLLLCSFFIAFLLVSSPGI